MTWIEFAIQLFEYSSNILPFISYSMIVSHSQTKLPTSSPLTESIPTKKDRHFYKPTEFIWNNPHRSSSRLYKYYHAAKDHYEESEVPRIQKLQQEDKENVQKERILTVLSRRSKTRQLLKQRQLTRELLEKKSQITPKNHYHFSHTSTNFDHLSSVGEITSPFDKNTCNTLKSFKTLKILQPSQSELPLIGETSNQSSNKIFTQGHLKKAGKNTKSQIAFKQMNRLNR